MGGSRELLPNCPRFQCLQALISPGSRLPVCGAKNAKPPGSFEIPGLNALRCAVGRRLRTVCLEESLGVGCLPVPSGPGKLEELGIPVAWSWLEVWGQRRQEYEKVLVLGSCASSANGQMTVILRTRSNSEAVCNSSAINCKALIPAVSQFRGFS